MTLNCTSVNEPAVHYIGERLMLERETEKGGSGVRAKKRISREAVGLMAIPCAESRSGGSGGHKQQAGCEGRKACSTLLDVRHRFLVGIGRLSDA